MKTIVLTAILVFFCGITDSLAQQRIAVLPFRNMDHTIKYNVWSIELADSLRNAIAAHEPGQTSFVIVPPDSVEMAIAELNLDPTNPQFESDMWKAVRSLGVAKVVQGNFQLRGERVLMACYVYDLESMLADHVNQAKDLFKTPTTYLDAVIPMLNKIYPGLK